MKKISVDDAETKSADLVAANIEQLKALFPEAFTEGKIDFEVLKQILGGAVDELEEKFGLNWHGKRRARQMALTPSLGTLRPCPDESVDWDTTQNLMIEGDNLEVFKLDCTNIRPWDPDRGDLSRTLFNSVEHVKPDRSEQDILFELLLKLGLELTVPIEERTIGGKTVHSVGVGSLFVCLATRIDREEIEPLAHGIIDWHNELAPVGETNIVFRDSAFADDVAKTNITAILKQHGLENVRSL